MKPQITSNIEAFCTSTGLNLFIATHDNPMYRSSINYQSKLLN